MSAAHRLVAGPASEPELLLTIPRSDDADAITAACQDPDIQAWTVVPSPYTRADAVAFLASVGDHWALGSAFTWAIRNPINLVGMVGLRIQPLRSAEVGYWLAPLARGRGYMARAVGAVVDHAFDPDGIDLDRLAWEAYVGNWPSRRVAESVGFTIEGTIRGFAVQRGTRRDAWVGTLLRTDRRPGA